MNRIYTARELKNHCTGVPQRTSVAGTEYAVWSDFVLRATMAMDMASGEIRMIKSSGYISNDLTIRKAIARAFNCYTFRR